MNIEQNSFQRKNLQNIMQRLSWLEKKSDGIIFQKVIKDYKIFLTKENNQIKLFFSKGSNISGVMSRIDLNNPLKLLGTYTQVMMLSLIWTKEPKRINIIGFGGGRLSMIFHHYFGDLFIDNVEIDQNVANLALKYFGIKADERMNIFNEDGRRFLQNQSKQKYDIILIDCFTGSGQHPYELSTKEFYETCKSRIQNTGVIVTNLSVHDDLFLSKVKTFIASFKYAYKFAHEGEYVFFGSSKRIEFKYFLNKAQEINYTHGFDFPFLERAKEIQRLSNNKYQVTLKNYHILEDQ